MGDKYTQSAKILSLLKKQGSATNTQLNKICFRYGARIFDLRKEGHNILSVQEKKGLWRFYLVEG